MINWFKKKHKDFNLDEQKNECSDDSQIEPSSETIAKEPEKSGIYARFKKGLAKTRDQLGEGVARLLHGKKIIDASIFSELEELLLQGDIGIETTDKLLKEMETELARKELADGEAVFQSMKNKLKAILHLNTKALEIVTADHVPFVILMAGINGAGKTTTIGKLASQYQQSGKKVMLAAGDTFRAAAVQQLQIWGERLNIPVIAQHAGADSASVAYDALQAATARHMDILIVDTAGRLHTQTNLMEELKKIKRVLQKINPLAPQETMLILDASIGQNALNQAREFHQAIGVTGISMTKLDGSAKGGIVFAIANELKIPFRYLGIGESIEDLRPFESEQFVEAIFS